VGTGEGLKDDAVPSAFTGAPPGFYRRACDWLDGRVCLNRQPDKFHWSRAL